MSLSRETLLELMAFADGELDPAARTRAERLLAESAEARQIVDGLRAHSSVVGAWLGEVLAPRASQADAVADAVMARLEGAHDPGGVVQVAPSGRPRSRRRAIQATAIAALACAAAALVYVRSSSPGSGDVAMPAPVARVPTPASPSAVPGPAPSATALAAGDGVPPPGVEVDEIDSPSRNVSIFEVPLGRAAAAAEATRASTVVVWIDDDRGRK